VYPPRHVNKLNHAITLRPYYIKQRHVTNVNFTKMCNLSLYWKHKIHQNAQITNHENANHDHFLPLRNRGVDFGLRIGSRGTPWNSKSAGPGGSDFTKCRFWPFIWHFGLFEGGSLFHTFLSLFLISIFIILSLFHFLHFVTFSVFLIFDFFLFLCFDEFCHFFIIFNVWHHFWSIIVVKLSAQMMTHFLSSKPALPLSPLLVVKLWPNFDH